VKIPTIGFDALTLAAVVAELRQALRGARVQKIQQPTATELILSTYGSAGAQRVLISADPKQFRVHLTAIRQQNPLHPPLFCQICRKHLMGAKVEEVSLPRLDRVVHFVFTTDDGEKIRLIAELMGRNANVALVSGAEIVRGTIRPTPPDGERPLVLGKEYDIPPGYGERLDPLTLTDSTLPIFATCPPEKERAAQWLSSTFSGMGKFTAGEIVARADEGITVPEALISLMNAVRREQFEPHSIVDEEGNTLGVWAFEPLTVPVGLRFPRESMSLALETFQRTDAERTDEGDERRILSKAIARETQFRKKELASAQATLTEAEKADRYEELGNNLLAALFRLKRGDTAATIPDLYSPDGQEIEIPLDPKKTPQENAEAYFIRARKARDAAAYAEGKVADLTDELEQLGELTERLTQAENPDDLATIRADLIELAGADRVEATGTDKQERRKAQRKPEKPFGGYRIRSYTIEAYTLLVGESAEANDYLTTRVASPTDLWFHVRAAPGAHAVLRTQGQPSRVPHPVLRRAAEIVAARSHSEKHAHIVPVDVVEKRYVRKPRGAKPGQVLYERERTLDVTPKL
jgi:predicted ribosome quality control (RQC) complex YloA/Tae2 family protein